MQKLFLSIISDVIVIVTWQEYDSLNACLCIEWFCGWRYFLQTQTCFLEVNGKWCFLIGGACASETLVTHSYFICPSTCGNCPVRSCRTSSATQWSRRPSMSVMMLSGDTQAKKDNTSWPILNGRKGGKKERRYFLLNSANLWKLLKITESLWKKGVITKEIFWLQEYRQSLRSQDSLGSPEHGGIFLCLPHSGGSLEYLECAFSWLSRQWTFSKGPRFQKTPFSILNFRRGATVCLSTKSRWCTRMSGWHSLSTTCFLRFAWCTLLSQVLGALRHNCKPVSQGTEKAAWNVSDQRLLERPGVMHVCAFRSWMSASSDFFVGFRGPAWNYWPRTSARISAWTLRDVQPQDLLFGLLLRSQFVHIELSKWLNGKDLRANGDGACLTLAVLLRDICMPNEFQAMLGFCLLGRKHQPPEYFYSLLTYVFKYLWKSTFYLLTDWSHLGGKRKYQPFGLSPSFLLAGRNQRARSIVLPMNPPKAVRLWFCEYFAKTQWHTAENTPQFHNHSLGICSNHSTNNQKNDMFPPTDLLRNQYFCSDVCEVLALYMLALRSCIYEWTPSPLQACTCESHPTSCRCACARWQLLRWPHQSWCHHSCCT